MEANIKITAAPMIEKSGDLAAILTNLEEGDILFIDEIHRLSPAVEEILYSSMEDYRIDIIIGSGPAAQTVQIDFPVLKEKRRIENFIANKKIEEFLKWF